MASGRHHIPGVDSQQQSIMARHQQQIQQRQTEERIQRYREIMHIHEQHLKNLKKNEKITKEDAAYIKEMQAQVAEYGLQALESSLRDRLDNWKKIPLNVAVIGQGGTGKSTFINTVRGLTAEHKDAAAIGVIEQTAEPHFYPHPDNPNLRFWDLPGIGTPNNLRANYQEKIDFDFYDFYIIITSKRFTEDDLNFALEIKNRGKKFFFIRGKVDEDIRNDEKDFPTTFDEGKTVDKIRQNCRQNLNNAHFDEHTPVFIISNRIEYTDKWEFTLAITTLMEDFPHCKKQAIIYSMSRFSVLTDRLIELTKEQLSERNQLVAVIAAGASCLSSVAGVNACVDFAVLSEETDFCAKKLGLNSKMIEKHKNKAKTSLKQAALGLKIRTATSDYIGLKLEAIGSSMPFSDMLAQLAIRLTNAIISYYLVSETLKEVLDEYAEVARREKYQMIGNAQKELD